MTPKEYQEILDRAVANKDLEKSDVDGDGVLDTKCNLGAQVIADEYGYHGFIVQKDGKSHGLMANEMMALFEAEDRKQQIYRAWKEDPAGDEPIKGQWTECDGRLAAHSASLGILTFAACYGESIKKLGKIIGRGSGHIAAVYTYKGAMVWSSRWQKEVPLVANIGKKNGVMGANWAFHLEPRYFILVSAAEELAQPQRYT